MRHVDYLIIANMMSGKGEAERCLKDIKVAINRGGGKDETIFIKEPTRISKIILLDIKIDKGVICIGGDGTVSETVGLMLNNGIKVPLRIVPTGTANIIAATLGIEPLAIFKDKKFIGGDNFKLIDVGVAEYEGGKEHFLLGVGLGFEEKFIALAKKGLKTKFGPLSYILTAFRELITIKPFPLVIKNEEKTLCVRVALLVAFNLQPKILNAFPVFPFDKIKEEDGVLNIFYVEYKNKIQATLGTVLFHVFGRANLGLVKQLTTNNASITSPLPCVTQIDGEVRGDLPVRLSVGIEKLRVYGGR